MEEYDIFLFALNVEKEIELNSMCVKNGAKLRN